MHYLQRSPWQGLQPHQSAELDTAILQPHRRVLRRSEAFQSIADEYAKRCALLLVSNDLRGAMNAAEISAAADAMARKAEADDMRAAERLAQFEQANPEDPAIAFLPPKPGARRRTRKPTTGV